MMSLLKRNKKSIVGLISVLYILIAVLLLPATVRAFEVAVTEAGLILKRDDKKDKNRELVQLEAGRNPFAWGGQVIEERRQQKEEISELLFEQFQLTGIIWDETEPMAIIDATLVGEGEQINGVTIQAIFRNEVLLESNNQHYFLRFKEILDLQNLEAISTGKTGESNG